MSYRWIDLDSAIAHTASDAAAKTGSVVQENAVKVVILLKVNRSKL